MKIGVFGSECKEDKLHVIKGLFEKLRDLKAEIYVQSSFCDFLEQTFNYGPERSGIIKDDMSELDIALSVGGDGTFLRTALQIDKQNIPILGINTGRLGFLADISSDQIDETLDELFRGDYKIEERSLLRLSTEEHAFSGFNYALNEIAILKRDTSSMITIHTFLNDDYLTSYQADGLVVATPTGSTAYSMSVNGPILLPQNRNFILSPVAPHSLNVRPIVIPDDYTITLKIESRTNSFLVSLDGRSDDFPEGIVLKINKADFKARLIKRFNQTFYQTLREKLMWGADRRS
ncbi:MAG: NAD kinase [Tannerella sp.]|jgi:NAD+ kinase|nr:NAD kinase [Tannerella sp.]